MSESVKAKPFLKWAGGKSRLVSVIASHFGRATRLVEPFVGGGSVFLGTDYESYLLADSNPDLINLFKNVQSNVTGLVDECRSLFVPENNTESRFYELREEFNSIESVLLRKSAIFVYMNKHAFNGLCRYNRSGNFNVPFGRYASPIFPEREILLFAERSQRAEFLCQDFAATFASVREGDVVYCDPPYIPLSPTASFTSYSTNEFGLAAQKELADCALVQKAFGRRVVISNHDVPLARDLYKDAEIFELAVHRSISSKSSTRGKVGEVLAVFNKNDSEEK